VLQESKRVVDVVEESEVDDDLDIPDEDVSANIRPAFLEDEATNKMRTDKPS
jgi:hypothetical protein